MPRLAQNRRGEQTGERRIGLQPLELALYLTEQDSEDRVRLDEHGWRVRHSRDTAGSPEAYLRLCRQHGVEHALVKLGPAGAMMLSNGKEYWAAPPLVDLVDTTGAGDALAGGLVVVAHDTPFKALFVEPIGLGLGTVDQVVPFQYTISGTRAVNAPEEPTAKQLVALGHDTAANVLGCDPFRLGVATTDQLVPFHCSISV